MECTSISRTQGPLDRHLSGFQVVLVYRPAGNSLSSLLFLAWLVCLWQDSWKWDYWAKGQGISNFAGFPGPLYWGLDHVKYQQMISEDVSPIDGCQALGFSSSDRDKSCHSTLLISSSHFMKTLSIFLGLQ